MSPDFALTYLPAAAALAAILFAWATRRRLARAVGEARRLQESMTELRCLLDAGSEALVIHEQGRVVGANLAFVEMFGLDPANVRSASLGDRLLPGWGAALERLLGGCGNRLEATARHSDGTSFPVVVEASEAGARKIVAIRDVSERKRAEADLLGSELRFRSFTDATVDAIVTADAEGRIVFWNAGASAMFGYTSAEVEGRPLTMLMPEHYRAAHEGGLARIASGGAPALGGRVVEVQGLRKDGSEFPLELTVSSWMEQSRIFFGGILRDITERKRVEAELRNGEERFRSITNSAVDAIVSADADGTVVFWNNGASAIFGYEADEIVGRSLTTLMPERYREAHEAGIARVASGGDQRLNGKVVEVEGLRKDGSEFPLELTVSTWSKDGLTFFSGILRDISERKRVEAQLRESEERFRSITDAAVDGIVSADAAGNIVFWNAGAAAMFGYSSDEILGQSLTLLMPESYREGHQSGLARVAAGGAPRLVGKAVEVEGLRKDGSTFPLELTVSTWVKGDRSFFGGILRDISERKYAQERIAHLAHHDGLTGLPNRILFRDRLDQALARGRRDGTHVAVLCLDLDRFKDINDVFGHPAGDALLQKIAERLTHTVREVDTVARLGGDEFAIVQVGFSQPSGASTLAERIIAELAGPLRFDEHEVLTGTSIGIAIAPTDGLEPDQLLKAADIALYRAKAEGRGTSRFFAAEMDACLQARRRLEQQLRVALAQQTLEIYYQPQIDLARNKIAGFEALLRWPHPDHGYVPPGEFIPIAEETGLILPLGEWVLRQACKDAATWPSAVRVSVNLSPVQFERGDLVEIVTSALEDAGLSPERLELEITEGALMRDAQSALKILRRIKELGIRIAMDDFGTGYSSLSYLRHFPFDKIKIDQSFVRGLEQSTDDAAIVRATLGLGQRLGLSTTAEGVETEGQLSLLRTEGCDEVQGFLCGRPTPATELPALFEKEMEAVAAAALEVAAIVKGQGVRRGFSARVAELAALFWGMERANLISSDDPTLDVGGEEARGRPTADLLAAPARGPGSPAPDAEPRPAHTGSSRG